MARFVIILTTALFLNMLMQGMACAVDFPSDSLPSPLPMSQDSFWGKDKHQHFVGSLIHTVFWGKVFQRHLGKESPSTMGIAAGITLSLGLGKEFRDARQPGNHFCWKDLLADALGVAVGVVLLHQP